MTEPAADPEPVAPEPEAWDFGTLVRVTAPRIYTSSTLEGDWTRLPDADVRSLRFALAPEVGEAVFTRNFGLISGAAAEGFNSRLPYNLLRKYVLIRFERARKAGDALPEIVDWVGVIEDEQQELTGSQLAGSEILPSGQQTWTAFELSRMLERVQLRTQIREDDLSGSAAEFPDGPSFNLNSDNIWTLGHNRSGTVATTGAYILSNEVDLADEWTADEVLTYLLTHHAPATSDGQISLWTIVGDVRALQWYRIALQTDGKTLKQALDELLPRKRGIVWRVNLSATFTEADDQQTLTVENATLEFRFDSLSHLDLALSLEGDALLPAADRQYSLLVDPVLSTSRIKIHRLATLLYHRVIVEGDYMTTTGTFKFGRGAELEPLPDPDGIEEFPAAGEFYIGPLPQAKWKDRPGPVLKPQPIAGVSDPPQLIPDWSLTEENNYYQAGEILDEEGNYRVLGIANDRYWSRDRGDQISLNQQIRELPLLSHVYRRWRLHPLWDGTVADRTPGSADRHYVAYAWERPDFAQALPTRPHTQYEADQPNRGPLWATGLKFRDTLPLQEGWDYADERVELGELPGRSSPRKFLPPLLFVLVQYAGGFGVPFWTLGHTLDRRAGNMERYAFPYHIDVRPAPDRAALELVLSGYPQHLLAKEEWSGHSPRPAATDPAYDPGRVHYTVDWSRFFLTIAVQHPERVSAQAEITAPRGDEQLRELRISLPEARLDYILPGTLVDVRATADLSDRLPGLGPAVVIDPASAVAPFTSTGGLLQDDRARVQQIARAAAIWYGTPRYALSAHWSGHVRLPVVGSLIRNLGSEYTFQDINTVVSSVSYTWSPRQVTCSLETNYLELELT